MSHTDIIISNVTDFVVGTHDALCIVEKVCNSIADSHSIDIFNTIFDAANDIVGTTNAVIIADAVTILRHVPRRLTDSSPLLMVTVAVASAAKDMTKMATSISSTDMMEVAKAALVAAKRMRKEASFAIAKSRPAVAVKEVRKEATSAITAAKRVRAASWKVEMARKMRVTAALTRV